MDMETIGGSRTHNNEAPLLLLCRCATIVIKDKDFSTPELVAIGADYSGMGCRIHTDASRSFCPTRARCGSPWF